MIRGEEVYAGQVIGEHTRPNDLTINIQKGKKLTNMRASGTDDNAKIVPKRQFSLEEAMEYIQKDEYLGGNAQVDPDALKSCSMKTSACARPRRLTRFRSFIFV